MGLDVTYRRHGRSVEIKWRNFDLASHRDAPCESFPIKSKQLFNLSPVWLSHKSIFCRVRHWQQQMAKENLPLQDRHCAEANLQVHKPCLRIGILFSPHQQKQPECQYRCQNVPRLGQTIQTTRLFQLVAT